MSDLRRYHPLRMSPEAYAEPNRAVCLTVCAKQRRAVLATATCAPLIIDTMLRAAAACAVHVAAYCLMPDHLHLVVTTQDGSSLEEFVRRLKGASSRALHLAGVVGPLWERSYWDRHLRQEDDLWQVLEYVLDNPVRKGLVARREDWPHAGFLGLDWGGAGAADGRPAEAGLSITADGQTADGSTADDGTASDPDAATRSS